MTTSHFKNTSERLLRVSRRTLALYGWRIEVVHACGTYGGLHLLLTVAWLLDLLPEVALVASGACLVSLLIARVVLRVVCLRHRAAIERMLYES